MSKDLGTSHYTVGKVGMLRASRKMYIIRGVVIDGKNGYVRFSFENAYRGGFEADVHVESIQALREASFTFPIDEPDYSPTPPKAGEGEPNGAPGHPGYVGGGI